MRRGEVYRFRVPKGLGHAHPGGERRSPLSPSGCARVNDMNTAATPGDAPKGHAGEHAISDEESRAAMRAFLQRSEVRLSTIHRVAQALLGGSALVLLLPLFIRDGFPKLTSLLVACYDSRQSWIATSGIAVAALLSIVLPVAAIFLLVGDRAHRGPPDRLHFAISPTGGLDRKSVV